MPGAAAVEASRGVRHGSSRAAHHMGRERQALPRGLRDHAVTKRGLEARCDVDVRTLAPLEDGVPRRARRRVDPVRLR
eukprot:7200281-Lingulodinium_polyedra.AAC.1